MKAAPDHLPEPKQKDLALITKLVRQEVRGVEMIILFGSYARGNYVEFDRRYDYGIPTTFSSDYDILILTCDVDVTTAIYQLDQVEYMYQHISQREKVHTEFLVMSASRFNSYVSEGRYFYIDIIREGVMLYDSGRGRLAKPRKLRYDEMQAQAREYFKEKWGEATDFLWGTRFYCLLGRYKMASFMLHQTCEHLYHCINLVFTLDKPKQHDLEQLIALTKKHAPELACVFTLNTKEDERLFRLLRDAYIRSRYDPKFKVTRRDIRALIPKVKLLRRITKNICLEKIASFDALIAAAQDSPGERR